MVFDSKDNICVLAPITHNIDRPLDLSTRLDLNHPTTFINRILDEST